MRLEDIFGGNPVGVIVRLVILSVIVGIVLSGWAADHIGLPSVFFLMAGLAGVGCLIAIQSRTLRLFVRPH